MLVAALAAGTLELPREAAHYVRDVLRLGPGARLELFDGRGGIALAEVVEAGAERVLVEAEPPRAQAAAGRSLTVALAAPKGERADWAVEKLTELGVARILWVDCERSVVRPRPGGRVERFQRVAAAAARQAGRADVPPIDGPVPFASLAELEATSRYVADRGGALFGREPLGAASGSAVLVVGPEGGLTSDELVQLRKAGYTAVRLGPWVLRVETAAVAGAALLLEA